MPSHDFICLPELDAPRRGHLRNRPPVSLLVVGVYGLAIFMIGMGFPVQVGIMATAAVSAIAIRTVRALVLPGETRRSAAVVRQTRKV